MNRFFGLPYFVWLTGCIVIAIVYFIFVPKEATATNLSSIQRFILKYAHSIVWVLLARGVCCSQL